MKNKKLLIIPLSIVALGIYAYLKSWGTYITHPNAKPELVPHLTKLKEIGEMEKTNPVLAEQELKQIIKKLPKKEQHKLNFSLTAGVKAVKFYGKVIDQYGKPVSDAKIIYAIEGQFLSSGSGKGFVMTDGQGNFNFDGKGASLSLYDVVHPQIEYNPPTTTNNVLLADGQNVPIHLNGFKKYSIDQPYVLKVWKTEIFENVKKGKQFSFAINSNGSIYTLDLNKERHDMIKEGEVNGHIRISCEREPILAYHDNQDWRITLESVGGGVQPTDDIYMNLAPETGYQSIIVIEQKLSSQNYIYKLDNQRYYFTSQNGNTYGSLFIHYKPNRSKKKADSTFENKCGFSISYKMNLEGTRNLAVQQNR